MKTKIKVPGKKKQKTLSSQRCYNILRTVYMHPWKLESAIKDEQSEKVLEK